MAGEPTLARDRDNDPAWVVYLQEKLIEAGYDPGPVDGMFGPRTEHAVMAYQQAYGLQVDGIVGRQTWASLQAEQPQPPGEGDFGDTPWYPSDGGGDDGGGDGGGDGTNGNPGATIAAPLSLQGTALCFSVANTGDRQWRVGEVIYDLVVVSEASGMATQVVNDQVPNNPSGEQWIWHTLATDQPGAYQAVLSLTVAGEPSGTNVLDFTLGGDVPETGGV